MSRPGIHRANGPVYEQRGPPTDLRMHAEAARGGSGKVVWNTTSIPRDGKIGKHAGGLGEEDGGGGTQPGICRTVFRSGGGKERRPGGKYLSRCNRRNRTRCICGVDYEYASEMMRETTQKQTY